MRWVRGVLAVLWTELALPRDQGRTLIVPMVLCRRLCVGDVRLSDLCMVHLVSKGVNLKGARIRTLLRIFRTLH